jgi:hypothetical protein
MLPPLTLSTTIVLLIFTIPVITVVMTLALFLPEIIPARKITYIIQKVYSENYYIVYKKSGLFFKEFMGRKDTLREAERLTGKPIVDSIHATRWHNENRIIAKI